MDAYEVVTPKQTRRSAKSRRNSGFLWNFLTCGVLLMTLCVGLVFALVYLNPQLSINPFPPPTAIPTIELSPTPTPTNTPRFSLPPTWTPTATLEPTLTSTPESSPTPLVSMTPSPGPTDTATPGPTNTPGVFVFGVQQGSPVVVQTLVVGGRQ